MPQIEQEASGVTTETKPYVSYLDKLREDPEKLMAHLERIGLPRELAGGTNAEIRGAVIEQMIRDRAGQRLELGDMSVSEYAHADHPY